MGPTSIGFLMKLSFHPYMDHQKRSPYATWTSVLLHAGPESRDGLELKWTGPPAWLGRPCWPPKVVAKEEDIQGLSWWVLQVLGVCSHLGQGPKDE